MANNIILDKQVIQELNEPTDLLCPISGEPLFLTAYKISRGKPVLVYSATDKDGKKINFNKDPALPYFQKAFSISDPFVIFGEHNNPYYLFENDVWIKHRDYNSFVLWDNKPLILPEVFEKDNLEEIRKLFRGNEEDIAKGYVFAPYITTVAPTTVSSSLLTVQPLSPPTGMLFYLDHIYGKPASKIKPIKEDRDIYRRKTRVQLRFRNRIGRRSYVPSFTTLRTP